VQQDEQQQGSDDRDEDGAEAPQLTGEEPNTRCRVHGLALGAAALRAVAQAEALGAFAQQVPCPIEFACDRAKAVTLVLISLIRGDREQGRLLAAQSLEPGEELDIRRAGREIVRSAGSRQCRTQP
jgi:hypothetical protein